MKVTHEQTAETVKDPCGLLGKNVQGTGKSTCKGPKVGTRTACSGNSKEAGVVTDGKKWR